MKEEVNKEFQALKNRADKGDVVAMDDLAIAYFVGDDVDQNIDLGMKYLELAVEGGLPSAQLRLGYYYLRGMHYEKNTKKAFEFILLAYEKDEPYSSYCLAEYYKENFSSVDKSWRSIQGLYKYEMEDGHLISGVKSNDIALSGKLGKFTKLIARFYALRLLLGILYAVFRDDENALWDWETRFSNKALGRLIGSLRGE